MAEDEEEDEDEGVEPFLEATLPPTNLLLSALSTSWATSFTEKLKALSSLPCKFHLNFHDMSFSR